MSESMEKAKFMKRPFALAKSSRQYIERLWKIGAEVSKFGASMASHFSPIFSTLAKTIMRILGFSREIREFSLTRIMSLPPFNLWSRRVTPSEDEYFPTEMGRANVSFLFNVTVAKKTAAKLARRLAAKAPRPILFLEPIPPEAELMEETIEEPTKTAPHIVADLQSRFESKLAPSIKGITAGFQEYGKKAILPAPLLEMLKPLLVEPARTEGPSSYPPVAPPDKEAPQIGLSERPLPVISHVPSLPHEEAKFEPLPLFSFPVVRLRQEAARSFGYATGLPSIVIEREFPILKAMPVFPQVSAPEVEPPLPPTKPPIKMIGPPVSMSFERLRPDVVRSLQYAAKLPSIVLEQEIPILKRMVAFSVVSPPLPPQPSLSERPLPVISHVPSLPHEEAKFEPPPLRYAAGLPSIFLQRVSPILETTAAFSTASPLKPSLPSIEPSYPHIKPTMLSPMRPSQVSRLLEEISPSLTSWIYGVSEILRGTTLSLSAVPVAASTAEKVVTETLTQPISSFEAPKTLATQEPVSPVLATSGSGTGVGHAEVEAFRLPALVTSLVVALSQRYPLLLGEPTVSEAYGTSIELTRVAPEETPAISRMPEEKSFSRLPTVIALAAAESLIAHRLHHEFSGLVKQMQVTRSSYGEKLRELGAFRPISAPVLSRLKAAAPRALWSPGSPAIEPYTPSITSAPSPLSRLEPVGPSIQNTFNITVSAESAEEDLRDLERKISKILSEQIRRYYGSPRI